MTQIAELVARRRAALPGRNLPKGTNSLWGLALSGGGIRSATFCFGLLRALARNDLLLRIDLLSTVSGGGFIGSTLGRLFARAANEKDVENINAAVRDANSRWFAWWLRANGRYLIPRGAMDRVYAIALYCRNLVGVHFEFGMMMLFIGVLLGSVNLWGWYEVAQAGYSTPDRLFPVIRHLPQWMPVIALVEPIVVLVGAVVAIAFWCVPWVMNPDRGSRLATFVLWLVAGGVALWAWQHFYYLYTIRTTIGETMRLSLVVSGWLLLVTVWAGVPLAFWTRSLSCRTLSPTVREDIARTWLTKALAYCFRGAAIIGLAGLIDRAAWFIAFELGSVGNVGLALGFAAAVARALFPKLSGLVTGGFSTGLLLQLGRLVGYLLTFLLCSWWVSVVYTAGLGALFQHGGPHFLDAAEVLGVIGFSVLAYLLLTGWNVAFLNLSSLHGFYRARLIRSYLGAANARRLGQQEPLGAIDPLPSPVLHVPKMVEIGDIEPYDDLPFSSYAPHACGGPVHLINMCINETRDPRGGLFNQDRRGLAFCVASGGYMKVAQEAWKKLPPDDDMTLGGWTAISGAAVAPGLGSLTRGGVSALAVFAGVRLGYWWQAYDPRPGDAGRLCAKSVGLLRETFGSFRGTGTNNWFLTDGGHFENTGAYALLAEKAEVIIVADCGADPGYAFGDLENLVRKARIDLQAEIILQKPVALANDKAAPSILDILFGQRERGGQAKFAQTMALFGSLNDLASDTGSACLAMARVTYSGDPGPKGFLILIKPNISSGLPVDLVNFKAQNPAFPQETTADQFFSEAQWESYSQLGYFLGEKLSQDFIAAVIAKPESFFAADQQVPFGTPRQTAPESKASTTPAAAAAAAVATRLPARIGSAAVRAGIGLGAGATLAVSLWQAIDSTRTTSATRVSDERSALKELSDLWVKITPQSIAAPDTEAAEVNAANLAAAIIRSAGTLCPAHGAGWFQTSAVAGSIYGTALQACGKISVADRPGACMVLLRAANPRLQGAFPDCLVRNEGIAPSLPAPRYWIYDYSDMALIANAHPCDMIATGRRREAQRENAAASSDQQAEVLAGCARTGEAAGLTANRSGTAAASPTPCRDKTIDLEVYGFDQMKVADAYRSQWERFGAVLPPTENVSETARLAGRATPLPMSATTVRYHDEASAACAHWLSRFAAGAHWSVEPLPAQFTATPGVIEVWLTP